MLSLEMNHSTSFIRDQAQFVLQKHALYFKPLKKKMHNSDPDRCILNIQMVYAQTKLFDFPVVTRRL